MEDTLIALLAALGVLGQVMVAVIVVGAVAWRLVPGVRPTLTAPREALRSGGVWMAWVTAAIAMAGSLWFQFGPDFVPCELCWFQRICMYPLVVILLVGALTRDERVFRYAIALPVVGIGVSAYHIYIEHNPDAAPSSCQVGGTSCAAKWIEELGYITIPTLAGTGFALIIALLLLSRPARRRLTAV